MSAEPLNDRRPAWRVIRAIHRELCRQADNGGVTSATWPDANGRVQLSGTVDLAMIAHVTEEALRAEFGR